MSDPKGIVREGYDLISHNYRQEAFDFDASGYRRFLDDLTPRLKDGDRVLDLGCGCGIPVARHLAERFQVTGVDISSVQINRAKELVPGATFLRADMTEATFPLASFEAIICFYAIIHIPVEEQRSLFSRLAEWLAPGGFLLITTGETAWTGTVQDWYGGTMYWSQTDAATYRNWLQEVRLNVITEYFIPEGDGGHALFLARKAIDKIIAQEKDTQI